MDHLLILGSLVRIQLSHQLFLSAKENESENFGVIKAEVHIDHNQREFTEALLDNPSERAIVWVRGLPLPADAAVTLFSIDIMRCKTCVLCRVSELGHDGN